MRFFDRYSEQCILKGIAPASQSAADAMGVTKSTISSWDRKNVAPKGETVAKMADMLDVSTDYLLGRTEDPTDHTKEETQAAEDRRALMAATGSAAYLLDLFDRLDALDRIRVQAYVEGILTNDAKYAKG
jgi:transcriptional regulator with XRE-family HTH domain